MFAAIQELVHCPPQRGLSLCEDFGSTRTFIPYREFPARIAACAAHFREAGVQAGDRVLLPFETSEEVIFSFFGLLQLGALPLSVKPYILSTPKRAYCEFLQRVAQRYRAARVLQVPGLASLETGLAPLALPPRGLRAEGAGPLRIPAPEELAFVQFSSGSTSFPKGIPVTHGKLSAHLRMIAAADGRVPEDEVTSWLPLYHDMGLIGGLLTCVALGNSLYLSQPASFLMDPLGWLELISQQRVMGTVVPNFAVDYLLKHLKGLEPEDYAHLDLSAVRYVYLGSEPINIENLRAFCALLAPQGLKADVFKPCYGMAEAVLMVSCTAPGESAQVVTAPNGQPAISVGRPLREFEVRLRTEDGRECGEGELGEIELRGGTLADAYFEDERPLRGADGFYATGDLGFRREGTLFITGRVNDRIKVNGQSFFASDFEQAVERLPFVRPGRTVVVQVEQRVVVLAEVNQPGALREPARTQAQVCAAVLERVGVSVAAQDVVFLRYGQILKTSSGKLQRRAMGEAFARGELRVATARGLRVDRVRMRAERLFYLTLQTLRQPRTLLALAGRGRPGQTPTRA